jgi:hypothetical protein
MLSSQLKTIETNLEKKIIKQLHEDDKMDVDSDRRMTELESRATHIRIWCLSKNACTSTSSNWEPGFQDWEALVPTFGNQRFLELGPLGSKIGKHWVERLGVSSSSNWEPVVPTLGRIGYNVWEPLVPSTGNPWFEDWEA